MKKIIILTFILIPFYFAAQVAVGTTHEEYKYLSKGFAYQKEMGLDGSKEGYTVKALFTASNGVQFHGLFSTASSLKGLIITLNAQTKNPIFLGIPTNDAAAEIHQLADEEAKERLNLNAKEAYDHAMQEFVIAQIGGGVKKDNYIGETEKNLKTIPAPSEVIQEYDAVVPLKMERPENMTERSGGDLGTNSAINSQVVTDHDFEDRSFVKVPIVKGQNPSTGTVVIKMCIDIDGNVKTAKFTQRGSSTFNPTLRKMALNAAKKVKFSKGLDQEQCGNISFKFQ